MGEAVFRNDLDNFVTELGDLLIHEGHRLAAEKAAARIFGADRAYLVLNGTSTSDKIALTALVAPGDLVLFDRNNHKAAHHGVLLLGGLHFGLFADAAQRARHDRANRFRCAG